MELYMLAFLWSFVRCNMYTCDSFRKNLANIVTASRVVIAFAIVILAVWHPKSVCTIFVLALVGCVSDLADGAVANRLGITSEFGSLFDRTADKILFIAIGVAIVFNAQVPMVWKGSVIFQGILDGYFLWRCRKFRKFAIKVEANFCSKAKMFLLDVGCLFCLLSMTGWISLSEKLVTTVFAIFSASIWMTFLSFHSKEEGYFAKLRKLTAESR